MMQYLFYAFLGIWGTKNELASSSKKKKNQLTHTTYVGPTRGKVLEHENTLFQHIHYMTES